MALSDEQIDAVQLAYIQEAFRTGSSPRKFARAIEAEVHKSDDALILQLVEALECCMDDVSDKLAQLEGASFNDTPELYAQERIVEIANNAITAARARLAEKGGPNVP